MIHEHKNLGSRPTVDSKAAESYVKPEQEVIHLQLISVPKEEERRRRGEELMQQRRKNEKCGVESHLMLSSRLSAGSLCAWKPGSVWF